MKTELNNNSEYITLLSDIKLKVRNAQIKASVRVNSELILMYWELGELIVKQQAETNWGEGFISQLSKDLTIEFPKMKGFSETNLFYIKKWYSYYSQISRLQVSQIFEKVKLSQLDEKFPQLVGELQVTDNSKVSDNSGTDKIVPQLVGEYSLLPKLISLVPWGHHREIISKCKDIDSALFYLVKTIENSWVLSFLGT